MGGMTRRDLLKKSAVAGGIAWTAPVLSTGTAWGQTADPCACGDGSLTYAKYAPGDSQTCQNQCLQPGDISRIEFECLVNAGVITVLDAVESNDDKASVQFNNGTRLFKLAIKSENDCFVVRCNEGFGQLYKWTSSTNAEPFDAAHQVPDPGTEGDQSPLFTFYSGGAQCGTSAGPGCNGPVTRVDFDTEDIPGQNKLNFIELELCVTNLSKIPCTPIEC